MRRTTARHFRSLCSVLIAVLFSTGASYVSDAYARKVKTTLKYHKGKPVKSGDVVSEKSNAAFNESEFEGTKVTAKTDTAFIDPESGRQVVFYGDSIRFAGYDKDVSSSRESFLVVNDSEATLRAYSTTIVYYDMQGRMLHSRTVAYPCLVPPKETRLLSIPTWDRQKSYFYYLGNQPRRVATPYKVEFLPAAYWIE